MPKLCINSRDELQMVDLTNVAYLKASGCYTDFHYVQGKVRTEAHCLSVFESAISNQYQDAPSPFFRLGRSYLVNTTLIASVSLPKGTITFTSEEVKPLQLSKRLLKTVKEHMARLYGKHSLANQNNSETKPYTSERI